MSEPGFKEGVWKEDAEGEGREGIDVDVFGCDTVGGEGWIGGGRRLLWTGSNAEFVGGGVKSRLEAMLEDEFEEYAVELDGDARHGLLI